MKQTYRFADIEALINQLRNNYKKYVCKLNNRKEL